MIGADGVFDAPIPGQSLTQHPGASPVEHPPKFVHLNDALEFVWKQFHKKKPLVKLIMMLKGGVPAEAVCRTVLYQGLLKSYWTVDLALLMFQTVLWQVEAIGKLKGIKVQAFNEDPKYNNFLLQTDKMLQEKQNTDEQMSASEDTEQEESTEATKFKGFF